MSWVRRKKIVRLGAAAVVLLGGVLAFLLLRDRQEAYVPGRETDGLIDTLARNIPDDRPDVRFVDVAEQAGVCWTHFAGKRGNRMPEDMGSGVALGDVDGDGWVDLFLVNIAGPLDGREAGWPETAAICRLYRNRGDGTFEDITERAGAGIEDVCMGAAFVDIDSDGDLDLFVSAYGHCRLLRNRGDATFEDVSQESGVGQEEGFWTGVAAADYDRDGDVDLYVCGYVKYNESLGDSARVAEQYGLEIPALLNPSTFEPERNLLFRNRGDGTFDEVAGEIGVSNTTGRSLSATFTDLSGDGLVDIYVANDVSDNALFVNDGEGGFADKTYKALVGDYRGAMGIAVGDYDNDLDPDIVVTHWLAQENALYTNMSRDFAEKGKPVEPVFMDEADRFGLGQVALEMVGWATGFLDFDNDGLRDLFVMNGSTIPRERGGTELTAELPHLFWNAGPERGFFQIGPVCGEFFRHKWVGRGGALFDYDLDGDQDLVVIRHEGPVALLQNDGGNARHSVLVRLRQSQGNRFALGSAVVIEAGGKSYRTQSGSQGSYLSQHAVGEVAFGLGEAIQIDRVTVTWPDGTLQSGGPFPADSLITWIKGSPARVELLPGKREMVLAGPSDIKAKRAFFAAVDRAGKARVAGHLDEAVSAYREALGSWPSHQDCLYYLANCLAEQGDEAEALKTLQLLVALHPESNRGWMQVGKMRLPGGDPVLDDLDAAEQAFTRSHEINKEESGPVLELGLVALLRRDFARADELLADAAALNASSIEAPYYRGWIAWLRGRRDSAARFLGEAHDRASGRGAKKSVSNEGETRSGGALLAGAAVRAESPLERWKTLAQRAPDVDEEYGALPEPGSPAARSLGPSGTGRGDGAHDG